MMKQTVTATILAVLTAASSPRAIRIMAIETATSDILAVKLRSTEYLQEETVDHSPASWTLNGNSPSKTSFFAVTHQFIPNELDSDRLYRKHAKLNYTVYLHGVDLSVGDSYALHCPYGDTSFVFDDRAVRCESIKHNQVAYSAKSEVRYANFAIWLGDAGYAGLSGTLPSYDVFRLSDNTVVATGTLTDFGTESLEWSGDHVYRIDLSAVPPGGPYKIRVHGHGASMPLHVGGDNLQHMAYVAFRGLFHMRCGCELKPPYTHDIRGPCHTFAYDIQHRKEDESLWHNGKQPIYGTEPTIPPFGGYHDAGDWDRRGFHLLAPIKNMGAYEAYPDYYCDGQYNIPGDFDETYTPINKLNGVPDILDEAKWGVLIWQYLQMDNGCIRWGTEAQSNVDTVAFGLHRTHPPNVGQTTADNDWQKWGTYGCWKPLTAVAAGAFLQLARLLEPFEPDQAQEYIAVADKAWAYAGADAVPGHKMYYYLQHYLLYGDQQSHELFKQHFLDIGKARYLPGDIGSTFPGNYGFYNSAMIMPYLFDQTRVKDDEIVALIKQYLTEEAETQIDNLNANPAYPRGDATLKGYNTNDQPAFAEALLYGYRVLGEQHYLNAAAQYLDYIMGLNPIGKCMITGLGTDRIRQPTIIDSSPVAEDERSQNLPGISIFGPGHTFRAEASMSRHYPPMDASLGRERWWADGYTNIGFNEFTTQQNIMNNAESYTMLAAIEAGGQSSGIGRAPGNGARHSGVAAAAGPIRLHARGSTLVITLPAARHVTVTLHDLAGRLVTTLAGGRMTAGRHTITGSAGQSSGGSYVACVKTRRGERSRVHLGALR